MASQINLVDLEYIDEKVDIHKEDVSSENQAPTVDKEDELSIKKDSHVGDENNINSAPILEDSTPRGNLVGKTISNEPNFSLVRGFVQVNNEIDVAMDDNNNVPVETELNYEVVRKRIESVELTENKKDLPILPQRDFEEREVCFEDSKNIAMDEDFDNCMVVNETDNMADDLGDCAELSEEITRELEELPTNKPEVIGQFISDLKLAYGTIDQNNIVDKVVKKVAEKAELTEECSKLVTTDNSSDEKASYNCDEDDANNTNISGVYSGIWADDSPLNPEDDKTSNVSYNSSVLSQLITLVGSLAVRIVFKKQEGLCK